MKSEQINELAKALATFQGAVKPVLKNKENPFFKSMYADILALRESCKKELSELGLSVSQGMDQSGTGADVLITTLMHTSGQWIQSSYTIKASKQDPQGIGSAFTYARRYAFAAILGLVTDDDDDAEKAMGRHGHDNNHQQPVPPTGIPYPSIGHIEGKHMMRWGKHKGKSYEEVGPEELTKSVWGARKGLSDNADWVGKVGHTNVERFVDEASEWLDSLNDGGPEAV
jgi:hypothetical protein